MGSVPVFVLPLTRGGGNGKFELKIIFKMSGQGEFIGFCEGRGLRATRQRRKILEVFLGTEGHLSADEFYHLLKRRGVKVGYTTVYRTLKLLVEAGIARTVDLGRREAHFEHKLSHAHHDHLVCVKCGKSIEFVSSTIEEIQEKVAKRKRFLPQRHSLVIYGLCEECR
jgi:Fur family ferric uptake transcriptional regulator